MSVTERLRKHTVAERHLTAPVTRKEIIELRGKLRDDIEDLKRIWRNLTDELRRIKRYLTRIIHYTVAQLIHRERNCKARIDATKAFSIIPILWHVLPYELLYISTDGRYDKTNYRYYAQKEGGYHVDCMFRAAVLDGADTPFNNVDLALFKNGILYEYLDFYGVDTWDKICIRGTTLVYLNEHDYIDIRLRHQNVIGWFYKEGNENISQIDSPYGFFDIHFSGNNCFPSAPVL